MINYCPNIIEPPLLLKWDIRKKLFESSLSLFAYFLQRKSTWNSAFYLLPTSALKLTSTFHCYLQICSKTIEHVHSKLCLSQNHTQTFFFWVQENISLEIHEYFTLIKHILLKLIVISKNTKYETVSRHPRLNFANVFFRDILGW